MSPYHLIWIVPALLALLVGAWWVGRRGSPPTKAAPHLDPEKVERERERIRDHADSRRDEIEKQADEWRKQL